MKYLFPLVNSRLFVNFEEPYYEPMTTRLLFAGFFIPFLSFSQHNFELYNDGALIKVQAGAEVYVDGDVHMFGASATLDNDGFIKTQGNTYSDNLFQQRGTGTYRIENSSVNVGERQFISGSYAVRGGQATTGVNDGSFFNLELDNDQGIVYLVGTGNIADVRGSVNFDGPGVGPLNRIITHDIGLTGAIVIPANGSGYDAVFGMMNNAPGNPNFLNSTINIGGNMSGIDAGYVQGKLRRAINTGGGTYGYIVGLEPAGAGAQRGFQYVHADFVANNYDVIETYFQTGLDNTFAPQPECSGYMLDYWGGVDHGQWIFEDINGTGTGVYEIRVWPQDDNFPAKSVWLVTKDNSVQGIADDCGPTPVGLDRAGFNGFSQFGVAAADLILLPIELIELRAEPDTDHIDVAWVVAAEIDLSHYELERSEDGIDFVQVDQQTALGVQNHMQEYHYEDQDVRFNQTYYYRLRSVNTDGTNNLSPIVTARLESNSDQLADQINIFPNPGNGKYFLNFNINQNKSLHLSVTDAVGKLLEQDTKLVPAGNSLYSIDLTQHAGGIYYVTIVDTDTNESYTTRIIKH